MNGPKNHNSFSFNEKLNAESLFALYGDDYLYMEEVFATVLKEYSLLAANINASYASQDIPALKAAVHKIKPIFGFVGLNDVQQQCQSFEHVCQSATSFDGLSENYTQLNSNLISSKIIIEEEKRKLERFNSQSS